MKPAPFSYHAPSTLAEALDILSSVEGARVLAGGQSLVPLMAMRLAQPTALVDLNRVGELSSVRRDNGHVVIGAMARQRTVERHTVVREALPVLTEVIPHIGHTAIRHRGTVGGSIAHADPAAELPTAVLTLDATLTLTSAGGERRVAAADFFQSYFTTALEDGELLSEIRIPVSAPHTGYAFEEFSRRHGDFAIAAVLAVVTLDPSGRIGSARVGIAGGGPVPIRARDAEALLIGSSPSEALIGEAALAAAASTEPVDDIHGPAEYRRHITRVLAGRALTRSVARAQEASAS